MGTSDHTISQVKAILGKLDRSIDQLRARRTTPAPAVPAGVNGTHMSSHLIGAPAPVAAPTPPPAPGGQLRAQPLRPAQATPWPDAPSLRR